MPTRTLLRASFLGVPVLADLIASTTNPTSFWSQFLPNLYYVGIVMGGLTLGWKSGLGIAVGAGVCHSLIGHFLQTTPNVRLGAELLSLLIIGFALVEERRRASDQVVPGASNGKSNLDAPDPLDSAKQLSAIVAEILRDIRTPIASIDGAAFLLSDQVELHNREEFLDIIRNECEHLRRMLSELSQCTEVFPLNCAATDVSSLLSEIVRLSALQHPDPAIAVRTEVTPSLSPLWCDAKQIQQTLVPFVTSAMDAMPGGGQILLAADQMGGQCRIQLKVLEQTVRAGDPASGRGSFSSTFDAAAGHYILAARRTLMQHGGMIRIDDSGPNRRLQFLTLPLYNNKRG